MYEPETEKSNRPFNDQQFRDRDIHEEQLSDSLKIYDPVRDYTFNRRDIKKFYGKNILDRMLEESRESYDDNISNELFNIMFDMCKNRGVALKSSVIKKNSNDIKGKYIFKYDEDNDELLKLEEAAANKLLGGQKSGNDFFMKLDRGMFRNPDFRRMFKSMFSVYGWLWSNIIRKGWKDTEAYPLKRDYYDNGLLVYSASLSRIAKDCFLDKDTVKSYLDIMQEQGIIKIEHITPVGKLRGQGVYILGTWQNSGGKIQEKFYINEVFLQ